MTTYLEISMTLDGFVTGPNVSDQEPMGAEGERIHDWMFAGKTDEQVQAMQDEKFAGMGAVIMGHTTFELGEGPWGDDPAFHAPCFVVSHEAVETIAKQGGTSYTFVTDGIERALEVAKAAAGDKDVQVMGGANLAQQFLRAGLLDELRIHLVHMLLGAGTRLFEELGPKPVDLELVESSQEEGVTHLRLRPTS